MAEIEITEEFISDLERNIDSPDRLKEITGKLHPGDIAEIIEKKLSEEEKVKLFNSLDLEAAGGVIVLVNEDIRNLLLEELEPKQIASIVHEMDSDDAADFLGELPEERSQKVLAHLPVKDSTEVRSLLQYPEDSAGGIMQLELVSLKHDQTCSDAIRLIRSKAEEVPELHSILVTDNGEKLVGVVPLRKLILNPKETHIKKIMEEDAVSVNVLADREEVAQIFRKYDVVSLPVVDAEERLLGRIMHDDVLDVITEENTEDMLKVAGTDEHDLDTVSWIQAARYRLPWLLFSLLGGVIMAGIITGMGAPLEQVIALAAFIPVITGMSGNVSTQSSAIVLRAIVLGKINGSGNVIFSLLLKELWVGLAMATFCGLLIGVVSWWLKQNPGIGLVVGLSLCTSMAFAAMFGSLIPLVLNRLKADPVLGAGPIVLTAVDISALVIYFTIAHVLLTLIL